MRRGEGRESREESCEYSQMYILKQTNLLQSVIFCDSDAIHNFQYIFHKVLLLTYHGVTLLPSRLWTLERSSYITVTHTCTHTHTHTPVMGSTTEFSASSISTIVSTWGIFNQLVCSRSSSQMLYNTSTLVENIVATEMFWC